MYDNEESFKRWDWWTATFAAAANIPFLLLQLPQIMLNAHNLGNGNKSALFAISWMVSPINPRPQVSFLQFFPPSCSTPKMSVKNATEHAYWFAWESLTALVLRQEEGDGSNDSAMLRSNLHVCGANTVSNG